MRKRLTDDFYSLKVHQVMDKRVWDLPIVAENEDILTVFNILGARSHIWVVNNTNKRELSGVITEHDVLSILAPKTIPSYVVFGMPDIRSMYYGTAKTAVDIMTRKVITCHPDDKIINVLQRMMKYRLRRLPVVVETKLVGQITLHQLIRKYYDATQYNPIINNEG